MKKHPFIPYANESDVVQIGNLMIENRVDRITLSGDIDLTLDQIGLAQAQQLLQLLTDVVAQQESQTLPASLPPPVIAVVPNPFD
ncbi:MAG: hypothetical protein ACI83P_000486 [Janthinobacterium sp.]|jgi:hypothetical protein